MGVWVGRYAIAQGEVLEHGPWLVERRRAQDDQRVRLLVLAEPTDERSAEFCHEVADAIAALFRRESLSVTGGLLRALRQAHANLAEWNRRSLREHRVSVAVTCVAIKDREATVAQVGPTVAYARSGALLRRLSPSGAAAQPLGGSDAIEPAFERVCLPEDELLLLTSNVEHAIGLDEIESSLAVGPERALAELFMRTRELQDMTAVLVADLPQVEDEVDGADEPEAALEEPAEPAPVARVESAPPPLPREVAPRARAPQIRRPRASLLANPSQRAQVLTAVVGVVLLSAVAWFTLPGLLQNDRAVRFDEIVAAVQSRVDAAANASDPASARAALVEAQSQLATARAAAPEGDARVGELDARVSEIAARLDRVTDLPEPRRLLEIRGVLTTPIQRVSLVSAEALWIVDHTRGRILVTDAQASAAPREVYRAGERYDGTVARDPAAVTWDQVGRRLLVIDNERVLWQVPETGAPTHVALRGAEDLRSVNAIAAYSGNLYVLDGRGGEVWRYLPAGSGYDSERTGLLGGASFTDARALVVDGDVFVLDGSGLRHFRQGQEQEQLLRGIDRAPQAPVALVQDVARNRLYVGDPVARRIVITDRAGLFQGQLRHNSLLDLTAMALSPDGATMYALTADGIYALDPLTAR
ncbi:MAG: hypothetical protein IT299_07745 [Dehalococcoidia bacterium]|nr:hypothetical protein [Dehalococcoidia bacterium]